MKKNTNNSKQRLFEMMGKLDKNFKPRLNENIHNTPQMGGVLDSNGVSGYNPNTKSQDDEYAAMVNKNTNNDNDEFFEITAPVNSEDAQMFTNIINQGIDSSLEGFTKSKFDVRQGSLGTRRVFNFHKSELPILLRRLRGLDTEEGDGWAEDIENYDSNINEMSITGDDRDYNYYMQKDKVDDEYIEWLSREFSLQPETVRSVAEISGYSPEETYSTLDAEVDRKGYGFDTASEDDEDDDDDYYDDDEINNLNENYATLVKTKHGTTHLFAFNAPAGTKTKEDLSKWENEDRGNREIHFVGDKAKAEAAAAKMMIGEGVKVNKSKENLFEMTNRLNMVDARKNKRIINESELEGGDFKLEEEFKNKLTDIVDYYVHGYGQRSDATKTIDVSAAIRILDAVKENAETDNPYSSEETHGY